MKLIVDSGSTKTDWIGVDENDSKVFETQTLGLNPQVLTSNIITVSYTHLTLPTNREV